MNEDAENRGNQALPEEGTDNVPMDGDDIIDLTEVAVDESLDSQGDGVFDDEEAISLDDEVFEEEEIVELVDLAEEENAKQEGDASDEPLELSDLVEEEGSEDMEEEALSDQSEPVFADSDSDEEDAIAGLDDDLSEAPIDMGDLSDAEGGAATSVDLEQNVVDKPIDEVGSLEHEAQEEAQEASVQMDSIAPSDAVETVVSERLSDDKLEAIVTQVVKETIEKKADRILLEVAETAIAKEIEKIKKAL